MEKFIDKISTDIPFTRKAVNIELNGRNLILTGANGSGKTSLVEAIHKKLVDIVRSKKLDELPQWERNSKHWSFKLNEAEKGSAQYQKAQSHLKRIRENIKSVTSNPNISISNHLEFSRQVDSGFGVIELFSAARQAEIQHAKSASGTNYDTNALSNKVSNMGVGNQLEQHLVNLYTRRSFAITENKKPDLEKKITAWLKRFDENLKFLMEDDSAHLKFDADSFKFYINQKDKEPYTFQNLSSGYSSIFSVFSTLLMRAEYLKISPSELCGVAFIDEIDAHLHVTLQRKILPFLSESFPGIQYIVTTHSPFVLTSVDDAEIYDISKQEQIGELSSYSYESVLEGLFDVSSSSDILQNKIRKIAKEIELKNTSINKLNALVIDIDRDSNFLDDESKYYLNSAKLEIKKLKKGG